MNWLQGTMQNMNTGTNMMSDYLKQAQGIQAGTIKPWETQQYRGAADFLNKQNTGNMENVLRMATAKGITGGALGNVMTKGNEGTQQNLLQLINQIYSQSQGQGMGLSQQAINNFMKWLQMYQQQKFEDDKMKAEKMSQIGGNVMSGIKSVAGGLSAI